MTHRPHDDEVIDALMADPAGDVALASFVADLRLVASGPLPVPTPALAALLAGELSADEGDLPATAVSNANGPARQAAGLPTRRKKSKMPIPQMIASLSLAGKIFAGAGVAAAATTGAATAGVLPGPVQSAVETVVSTATPFELREQAKTNADFGTEVSTDARDGTPGVDGAAVSDAAKQNSQRPEGAGSASADASARADGATGGRPEGAGSSPASVPPVSTPAVSVPAVSTPAASVPTMSTPPVSVPPISTPPVSVPPISTPPVSVPPVKAPTGGRP